MTVEKGEEANSKISQILADKEKYEEKYNEKRRALKELEKETSVKAASLERELAVHVEKLVSLSKKSND